jgi:hypothetical protein
MDMERKQSRSSSAAQKQKPLEKGIYLSYHQKKKYMYEQMRPEMRHYENRYKRLDLDDGVYSSCYADDTGISIVLWRYGAA